jgi:hypothetical protein
VEVKVADDHVATVDKYGVIFALNKGVTIVHAAYMSYVDEVIRKLNFFVI